VKKLPQSDAEYYQVHKDDPQEWKDELDDDQAPSVTSKHRLDAIVSVRFTAQEERVLRATARRRGATLSNLIRQAALGQPQIVGLLNTATTWGFAATLLQETGVIVYRESTAVGNANSNAISALPLGTSEAINVVPKSTEGLVHQDSLV
jgi:hypothetical protein